MSLDLGKQFKSLLEPEMMEEGFVDQTINLKIRDKLKKDTDNLTTGNKNIIKTIQFLKQQKVYTDPQNDAFDSKTYSKLNEIDKRHCATVNTKTKEKDKKNKRKSAKADLEDEAAEEVAAEALEEAAEALEEAAEALEEEDEEDENEVEEDEEENEVEDEEEGY